MRVHIDFNVLEKNGNDYLKYSSELNDILTNLKERQKNIHDNWLSTNGEIYDVMFNNFVNDVQNDVNRIQRYGNTILGINDDFKQTDLDYAKNNAIYDSEVDKYANKYN